MISEARRLAKLHTKAGAFGGTTMNVDVKFQQKPMGLGTVIGILILTAQYLGLALLILVMIKGSSVLNPVAPIGQDLMALIAKMISAATPAGH